MRVLCACEQSQAVTKEFRRGGVECYSCDLLPASGGHPEWHIQCDALEVAKMDWDMVIAFPPCTHLAVSGAKHFEEKRRNGKQQMAIGFFLAFTALDHVPRVCIENPVGIMSTEYRKPTQIISPWMFGDPQEKKTCLWLKGLPKLEPTKVVEPERRVEVGTQGHTMSEWYAEASNLPHYYRSIARAVTFPGIARAMARQWGNLLEPDPTLF